MSPWVGGVILVLCGVGAVVLVVDLVRDRAAADAHFLALALVELAVLVQLVTGSIALARTDRDVEGVVLVSYLVTVVLVPVAAAIFALAERSRVGTTILLLAMATVAGLEARILDLWSSGA